MINELAIHMSHCFGMIKLGIIYLLPKYFDYNPLNIIRGILFLNVMGKARSNHRVVPYRHGYVCLLVGRIARAKQQREACQNQSERHAKRHPHCLRNRTSVHTVCSLDSARQTRSHATTLLLQYTSRRRAFTQCTQGKPGLS